MFYLAVNSYCRDQDDILQFFTDISKRFKFKYCQYSKKYYILYLTIYQYQYQLNYSNILLYIHKDSIQNIIIFNTFINNSMNIPKTQCAFHKNMIITHFCQSTLCLLPLCQQCIPIHKQQHTQINQNLNIIPIQITINSIQKQAAKQNNRIQTIYRQTLSNFQKTITLHHNLKKQIFDQQSQLINAISSTYSSMIFEIQNSIKRKENWFRQFTIQVNLARTQLINIQNSLNAQKYLRSIIMWNKIKPHDIVSQIIINQKVDWAEPKYEKINMIQFVSKLSKQKNLQLLELVGDMGIGKVIRAFQVLRFGQDEPRSPRQPGIFVTGQKKKMKRLNTVKSVDKF